MDLPAIWDALADTLGTIDGLRAHATEPEDIVPPVAVVLSPSIVYDDTMSGGSRITFPVLLLVARSGGSARALDMLGPYLSTTGALSIVAAIDADRDLGGTVDDTRVTAAPELGAFMYAEVSYVGARLTIEVLT